MAKGWMGWRAVARAAEKHGDAQSTPEIEFRKEG